MNSSFNDMWAPTWVVQETIPGALKHTVENTTRTFRSGRPVKEVVFFNQNREEVDRREGMLLTSKKGNEYCVCRREANSRRSVTITPAETASHAPTVGELFSDL